jgi:hypothetical protein
MIMKPQMKASPVWEARFAESWNGGCNEEEEVGKIHEYTSRTQGKLLIRDDRLWPSLIAINRASRGSSDGDI